MRCSRSSDTCLHRLRSAVRLLLLVVAFASIVPAVGPALSSARSARAARTVSLSEVGRLHLTSHHGFTLNEQGTATGTIKGRIYLHLNIVATNRVTAEVNIYPSGGSLSGVARASYRVMGETAAFSGSFSIRRGTGVDSHARGSGLKFTGTIQRSNDAVTVHLSGTMSY
jgi:hypothetical protein